MSSRYWIAAIAFGLTFAFTPAWSQGDVQDAENGNDTTNEQAPEEKKPSFVTAIEGVEAAIRELIRTESAEERKRQADQAAQDLEAQAEMAEWAREVGIGTVASAVFTFGGLILIWQTLRTSRETLKATQEMARETTRIGEAQVRAYVTILAVGSVVHRKQGAARLLQLTIDIQNTGNTAAKNTTVKFRDFQQQEGPMPLVGPMPEIHYSNLVPGDTADSTVDVRFDESRTVFDAGEAVFYMRFTCETSYTDVFGKTILGKDVFEAQCSMIQPTVMARVHDEAQ